MLVGCCNESDDPPLKGDSIVAGEGNPELQQAFNELTEAEKEFKAAKARQIELERQITELEAAKRGTTTSRGEFNGASGSTRACSEDGSGVSGADDSDVLSSGGSRRRRLRGGCMPSFRRLFHHGSSSSKRRRQASRTYRSGMRSEAASMEVFNLKSSSSSSSSSSTSSSSGGKSSSSESLGAFSTSSVEEELVIARREVDSLRKRLCVLLRQIESMKEGVIEHSFLELLDEEEAERVNRLRMAFISACVVDLWLYDSEALEGKLRISVLEHPASVLSAVASDLSLLAHHATLYPSEDTASAVTKAYRSLAIFSNILIPPATAATDGTQFLQPIVDTPEDILDIFVDKRDVYEPLMTHLASRWGELVRGVERYRSLVDLCQSEPLCMMTEIATMKKFRRRLIARYPQGGVGNGKDG